MRKYHSLRVAAKIAETPDSVRVALDVPADAAAEFDFLPGQHLPVQATLDGKVVRRTYSLCSVPGQTPLELGIRIQPGGLFSGFVANDLEVGSELQAMPPFGQFHANIDPGKPKTCLAFAAGSGITPIMSIVRATLERESNTRFLLFYGNRSQQSTMFVDDLYALKNRFPDRLALYFLFSQEDQEFDIFKGRLDTQKVSELYAAFCRGHDPDDAYICGPGTMIESVQNALTGAGMELSNLHSERFGAPRREASVRTPADKSGERRAEVSVIMDGHRKSFEMPFNADNIVDAAAENGIDLPHSCKGGVCATCRTHVREGSVQMATNYGLEPWEVEKGFVLACQSVPTSDRIVIDYDKT